MMGVLGSQVRHAAGLLEAAAGADDAMGGAESTGTALMAGPVAPALLSVRQPIEATVNVTQTTRTNQRRSMFVGEIVEQATEGVNRWGFDLRGRVLAQNPRHG